MSRKKRNLWKSKQMCDAIEDVRKGQPISVAAKKNNVPQGRLQQRLKSGRADIHLGKPSIFTYEEGVQLVHHVHEMEARFFGLTRSDLLRHAFEFAKANNKCPQAWKTRNCATLKRYCGFRQRHRNVTLRKAEATSLTRTALTFAKGF